MAIMRTCPVFRADVVYEVSCVPCKCFDGQTTECKVISGKMKAHNEGGLIVVDK